jgi:ribosomal protein L19
MVTHINLQDIVIGDQIPRQHAKVIQAAKQTVNQNNGRIIVRRLCRLRSGIQFHGKVLFLRMSG